jgi:hypothetical protein
MGTALPTCFSNWADIIKMKKQAGVSVALSNKQL